MTKTIKVNSLELPDNDTYKLVKIKAKAGQLNMVSEGDTSIGDLRTNPICIGARCTVSRGFSNYISTSFVVDIELTDDPAKVLIHTESGSTYELVNLDMGYAFNKV
mgnify:CR=1 FL=1